MRSACVAVLLAMTTVRVAIAQETQERPKLVVMGIVSEGDIDSGVVRLLDELLLTEFQQANKYIVTGGSDINALLSHEVQKDIAGCSDVTCMQDLTGALGADLLVVATIGRVGGSYLVNIKIVNVNTAVVEARWSEEVGASQSLLTDAIRRSVSLVTGDGDAIAEFERLRGSKQKWGWVALGTTAVLGGGAGVLAALTASDDNIRGQSSVGSAIDHHNNMVTATWVLAGAAAVAGVFAIFEFSTMPTEPWAATTLVPAPHGAGLALAGRF